MRYNVPGPWRVCHVYTFLAVSLTVGAFWLLVAAQLFEGGYEWYGHISREQTFLTFLRRQKLQALAALRARDGNLSSMA